MSDGEERESLSREIDPAIWAIAPRLHQEEGPVDVTASPAFQCLDEVCTVSTFHKDLYIHDSTDLRLRSNFLYPYDQGKRLLFNFSSFLPQFVQLHVHGIRLSGRSIFVHSIFNLLLLF